METKHFHRKGARSMYAPFLPRVCSDKWAYVQQRSGLFCSILEELCALHIIQLCVVVHCCLCGPLLPLPRSDHCSLSCTVTSTLLQSIPQLHAV
jgi:hypothetical protein